LSFLNNNTNNNNNNNNKKVRKSAKYAILEPTHVFQLLAFENLGPMNESAIQFFSVFGQKISSMTGMQIFIPASINIDPAFQCHFTS